MEVTVWGWTLVARRGVGVVMGGVPGRIVFDGLGPVAGGVVGVGLPISGSGAECAGVRVGYAVARCGAPRVGQALFVVVPEALCVVDAALTVLAGPVGQGRHVALRVVGVVDVGDPMGRVVAVEEMVVELLGIGGEYPVRRNSLPPSGSFAGRVGRGRCRGWT